jgi:hypothetical protein
LSPSPSSSAAGPRGRSRWWLLLSTGLVALAIAAIAAVVVTSGATAISGELTACGGRLGAWTLTPDRCEAGAHYGFFGVDLFEAGHPRRRVRLIKDVVNGTTAVVLDPRLGEAGVRLDAGACETFVLTARQTDSRRDGISGVAGEVELACPALRGRVAFEGCY